MVITEEIIAAGERGGMFDLRCKILGRGELRYRKNGIKLLIIVRIF